MKHCKKLLSTLLALVIALSAVSVGFYAFAQEGEAMQDPLASVEQQISDWYSNHRNNLYSTKAENADEKAAARKAYDEINEQLKALTENQRFQLNLEHYGYWLQVVLTDVTRNLSANPEKSPSAPDKCKVMQNNISALEDVIGKFPKDYADVLDAYQVFNEKAGSYYLGNTSSQDFKKADMQALLDKYIASIKSFTFKGFLFSDLLTINPSGGFYFGLSAIRSSVGVTAGNLVKLLYNKNQDLSTKTGKDPVAPKNTDYVTKTGKKAPYVYTYKNADSPQKYLDDFDTYCAQYQTDVIDIAARTYQDVYDILADFDEFKNLKSVDNAIYNAGKKIINEESVAADEVKAAIALYNSLLGDEKALFDSLAARSEYKLLPYVRNPHTLDELTPEILYTKTSSISTYKLSDLVNKCNDFLYDLLLKEFEEYIKTVDLNKKNETIIKTAQTKYAELPSAFKSKISSEALAKFTELVKPDRNPSDMSQQIKAFRQTAVILPTDNCPLGTQANGIQIAVDDLWSLVSDTVLPLVIGSVKVSEGVNLDKILAENVYTNAMVAKIFSLYATLSHNETDLGVAGLTLGRVIEMLCSPSNIAKALEEDKYSKAAEIVKTYSKLDDLAKQEFVSGDFGFKDGDRNGFVDALLAVLRPITTLLAPGAKAIGVVALNINMFDYVDGDGVYQYGAYSELIPLLEQLGLTTLPTPAQYKKQYEDKSAATSKNIAADEFLRPVINSLLTDLVDMVSSDPLNGVIKVLPRLAYILSTDMLNTNVKAALSHMGMLSGLAGSLDLSQKAITDKLIGQPIDLTSIAGTKCELKLKPIDWNKLANCATVKVMPSASNTNEYFVLRTGDTTTCFTTVFYYIHAVAFADKANYEAIKSLINTKLSAVAGIITDITNGFADVNQVESYKKLLNFFQQPTKPLPEIKIDVPDLSLTKKNTIDASKCIIKLSKTAYKYDGKAHKPAVTVTYKGKKLKLGTDYSVSYIGGCKNTGKYGVTVSLKGKYSGYKNLYFTINPKNTTLKSVAKGKKSFTVKWNKKTSQITGYQIQYSTSKNFKNAKTVTIDRTSVTSKKIKGLKGKKKYYVRIRTYKNFSGAKAYSSWSKAKTVVTKK